jgi:hypothetical protein
VPSTRVRRPRTKVEAGVVRHGRQFGDEFTDETLHERRVEDAGGLREAAQGTARHAEHTLDLLEGAGLLKAAQGLADGVEHE